MVGLFLLVALAVPQGEAGASLVADRTMAQVGDSVTLSVTVRAPEVGPVDIDEPALAGFDVVERRDHSQVSVGTGVRTTHRDLVLRTRRPGSFALGPFRIRVGGSVLVTNVVHLTVADVPRPGEHLSPRVQEMLANAAPPQPDSSGSVEVTVLRSADSVRLGDQIDLVVAAWFPRDARARLRAPPSLLPPDVRGAWGYAQAVPSGVVMSRTVEGQVYDLFMYHEIVFALTPGDLEVGPAKVTYSLPISGSFLSREVRHEEQSAPFLIGIMPVAGVPPDRVVAGRDVSVTLSAPETLLPVGDAARLTITLAGSGNVALWPEPDLRWPPGIHAYQERSLVDIAVEDGVLGGTKQFEYLVVADSAGIHRLPGPLYEYFDLDRDTVRVIRADPMVFETPETAGSGAPLRSAPPLLRESWVLRSLEWLQERGPSTWIAVFVVPPLFAGLLRLRGRRRPGRARGVRTSELQHASTPLEEAVRETLHAFVPDADGRGEDQLADALVAAGVEATLAAHAARIRERLRQARYGPEPQADAGELTEEVAAVLKALEGRRARENGVRVATALLVTLGVCSSALHAQSLERLWDAGAVRNVAESLTARVQAEPHNAVQWFNLSLAWEQLGESARARAAWIRAARAAPHEPRIASAGAHWARQPNSAAWVGPITPAEALAMAALCWVLGWMLVAARRRVRVGRLLLIVAVTCAAGAGVIEWRYRMPYALVIDGETPLREAPYGPARSRAILDAADVVVVERTERDWRRVSVHGMQGWLHTSEVLEP
jgi:hypothetical protein